MAEERAPCSVVLEGGVTSAVIYASLLARLSRNYTFRDLGGASSGAVAAAAAAAAEFACQKTPGQPPAAFDALHDFSRTLAEVDDEGHTTLFRLFQPKPEGLSPFRVAMAALDRTGGDSLGASAGRVSIALVENFPWAALLLALPVVGTGWIAGDWLSAHPACRSGIAGFLLCGAGWILATLPAAIAAMFLLVLWALLKTLRALRDNHWGLCGGMSEAGFNRHALTPTLHGFFQALAGQAGGPPLTFGDLWWGPRPGDGSPRLEPATRQIDLQIITTAVSLARPVRLPGEPGEDPLREFFYDPGEWGALFPPDVMRHLKTHARPATLRHDDGRTLLALPEPKEWPVVMAARFSLSFPVLLSALPMYVAVPRPDMLRAGEAATKLPFEARRVYFSDGGITSNCPVHLFDVPLPRFPTFGINLYRCPPGAGTRVLRSDTRQAEVEAAATTDAAGWRTPLPFLMAIVSTMMDWRDTLQRSLPGYRERIVHIGLPADAGGLHLAMRPETIELLAGVGIEAAGKLRDDFSKPESAGAATAWDRHRWTRARTTLSALRAYLAGFVGGLGNSEADYLRLLRVATPIDHPFQDETARQQALELAEGSRSLMRTVESTAPPGALEQNAPRPLPGLHMSPPW
jgi:hypothetical protein